MKEPKIPKIPKAPRPVKAPKDETAKTHPRLRYFEGVGRRKTSVARVRISNGKGQTVVNDRDFDSYFQLPKLKETALASLGILKLDTRFDTSVKVSGGGKRSQAEAVRHGLARALVRFNDDFKKRLRVAGFLTRDPRMVERKKYGLKKARRAPQWKKR